MTTQSQNAPRKRWLSPTVQKWIRRTHMYSGLALVPWVVLYGVTGVLFNHSSWMGPSSARYLGPEALREAGFEGYGEASDKATRVLEELSQRAAESGTVLALEPATARWSGSLSLYGETDELEIRHTLHPEGAGGKTWTTPVDHKEAEPEWVKQAMSERVAAVPPMSPETATVLAAALLPNSRSDPIEARVRRLPSLEFDVLDGTNRYHVQIDGEGDVDIEPSRKATLRRRLLRLHLQHGDPGYSDIRSAWALIVDAMGVAMVIWGLSGIIMWWSIKRTRRAGLVALLSGVGAMAWMAILVWRAAGYA